MKAAISITLLLAITVNATQPIEEADRSKINIRIGTFITGKTDEWILNAIRASVHKFNSNSGRNCTFRNTFFVGKSSGQSRFKEDHLEPSLVPGQPITTGDIFQMGFQENMNSGKSLVWLENAVKRYPGTDYIVKRDTDTVVDYAKLCSGLLPIDRTHNTYFGRANDFDWCGQYHHCPPPGCKDFSTPDCWIYMSGGFYGVSWNLANLMISHKNKAAYKIGIEDLQTGRLIQAVARTSRQPINVVSWQNGLLWCHFKHRTNVTWAILSGDSHVWDDCDKRR